MKTSLLLPSERTWKNATASFQLAFLHGCRAFCRDGGWRPSFQSCSVDLIPVYGERLSELHTFRDAVWFCFYQCLCNGKSS